MATALLQIRCNVTTGIKDLKNAADAMKEELKATKDEVAVIEQHCQPVEDRLICVGREFNNI